MIREKVLTESRMLASFYGRNPFEIADALNITVMVRNDFVKQKGAFKVILNRPFIFLNGNLSDEMQRIVVAHEIGHAVLHRNAAVGSGALLEFELFDKNNIMEYEANLFAANLLLDEDDIKECIDYGYDLVQTAQTLKTNVNLLLLKLQVMKDNEGYKLPDSPRRNFLGKISDSAGWM